MDRLIVGLKALLLFFSISSSGYAQEIEYVFDVREIFSFSPNLTGDCNIFGFSGGPHFEADCYGDEVGGGLAGQNSWLTNSGILGTGYTRDGDIYSGRSIIGAILNITADTTFKLDVSEETKLNSNLFFRGPEFSYQTSVPSDWDDIPEYGALAAGEYVFSVDNRTPVGRSDYYVDLSVSVVPEPGSLPLLFALACLFAARRKAFG